MNGGKIIGIIVLILVIAAVVWFAVRYFSVETEGEGALPDVEVDLQPGELPEYDVIREEQGELPDIDVEAEGGDLPDVDVETGDVEVREVPVPVPQVEPPDEEPAETPPR
jgi:hypothetical protein